VTYGILSTRLHRIADSTQKYFRDNWGINRFAIEKFVEEAKYVPTFSAVSEDFHHLWIQVDEVVYSRLFDSIVVECFTKCIPARLFCSVPKGLKYAELDEHLHLATERGVGILEVDEKGRVSCRINALSLSLVGLRPPDTKSLPKSCRHGVWQAAQDFRSGEPVKGCAGVYDVLENVTRKLAKHTHDTGLWNNKSAIKFSKDPWSNVMRELVKELKLHQCNCPDLTIALLHRVSGMSEHRNDVSHTPKSKPKLIQRDRELRTRFENAEDVLREIATAVKPLKGFKFK
jgi:hypothetical protein